MTLFSLLKKIEDKMLECKGEDDIEKFYWSGKMFMDLSDEIKEIESRVSRLEDESKVLYNANRIAGHWETEARIDELRGVLGK